MLKSEKKLTLLCLILLSSFLCSNPLWANESVGQSEVNQIAYTQASEADTTSSVDEQLKLEAQLHQFIDDDYKLDFKSLIAKIYAARDYQPLWIDSDAKKLFLQDYTILALSGISQKFTSSLTVLTKTRNSEGLVHDILLTDAFLNYLYYSQNVNQFAQKWLYNSNSYAAGNIDEESVKYWLEAVQNNQEFQFIRNLSSTNPYYLQTVNKVVELVKNINESAIDPMLQKLALNAQRLRILPAFDNGIFVNIPSYKLYYYRDGQLVLTSKVIVGKNSRRTPVMQSKLSNVVVNPPWNAPSKLINEDIIPKVRQDPSYLERNGYTILNTDGSVIDPYSLDWEIMSQTKFPYRLRQAPSDDSALGRYKFNMPSSEAIYLHDTPKRNLFNNKNRALSSGCVRVEKSDQLATLLLKEAGWDENKKSKVLESRKTTWATVQSDNPVFLYYVTAWVDAGKIYTANDIYRYDSKIKLGNLDWAAIKSSFD